MMLELKSSYHYLMGDLSNKCLGCELGFFSLNQLIFLLAKPPNPPKANLGIQVSFETHTI
jgi:hypothetical protein